MDAYVVGVIFLGTDDDGRVNDRWIGNLLT